ncbi:MAG: amidohydrolase family protein [Bacteroidetes bacterium]|nr:amidohydrolase family protein [Bacteroidota bacterium]
MQEQLTLIENAYVFTGDKERKSGFFPILIKGDTIQALGERAQALSRQYSQLERIDQRGKVIVPGFIEPFFKGESIILRCIRSTIFPDQNFTNEAIQDAYRYLSSQATLDELTALYKLAYFSALKMGITTLVEYGLDSLDGSVQAACEAMRQAEIRGMIGLHSAEQYEVVQRCSAKSIRFFSVLPPEHDLTLYNLQSTLRYAHQYNIPILVKDSSTKQIHEAVKKKFGKSILQICKEFKVLEIPTILLNVGLYESSDLHILREIQRPVIITLEFATQRTKGIPRAIDFLNQTIPLTFATGWGVPRQLEKIRDITKLCLWHEVPVSPYDMVGAVTIQAAHALFLEREIGSIEEGKKADLLFIDCTGILKEPFCSYDYPELLMKFLISETESANITDVMIGGEFVIRDGNLLMASEELLVRDIEKLVEKIYSKLPRLMSNVIPKAEIFKLPTIPQDESDAIPFEEGFRVIKKKQPHDNTPRTNHPELPKNVQRIYGDDDIQE